MHHLVETQQFDRASLKELFELATALETRRDDSLHGKILASLFFEPSTRTRFSFESAMYRLGGHVITAENATEASSATKGETLEDTIRVMNNYADVIVMRSPEAGAAERAAAISEIPVINAGDGAGQHPTQALLDLYTIDREIGHIDGVHVAIIGDLRYGRAARSLAYLLSKYNDIKLTLVSSPELRMADDIKAHLDEHHVSYTETESMKDAMAVADVIYQTRVQKERFPSIEEYERFRGGYIIDRSLADSMKPGAIIIHPLPRVGEIMPEVDDSPHAVYFKQVGYGLIVRMAILSTLLDKKRLS
ncbi:MAG: Aspartate carbamoyltransferase [Candidatus Kaiserbacteria bacterium]|nr:Aspartate carbamoyltransferase [Candidatus Kaiserbacteria bacterium]